MAEVGTEYFFNPVSDKMFGANILFNRDRLADGSFDEVAEKANVSAVRYPGGTVSERYFDPRDPTERRPSIPIPGPTRTPTTSSTNSSPTC